MRLDAGLGCNPSLAGNHVMSITARTVVLTPRMRRLPTILACAATILSTLLVARGKPHSAGHGRLLPVLASLALVLVLFRDPVAMRITALCQVSTLATLVDAATWLAGRAAGVPFMAMVTEVRWVMPVLPLRTLSLALCAASCVLWTYAWKQVIRPLSERRRGTLVTLLSAQALLLSELALLAARTSYVASMALLMLALGVAAIVLLFAFPHMFAQGASREARVATAASRHQIQAQFIQNLHAYAGNVSKIKRQLKETADTLRQLMEQEDMMGLDTFLGEAADGRAGLDSPFSRSLAISSLLSAKRRDCHTLGIRLSIPTRMDFATMSEFDACTVLSNLLDNAIRASRRRAEGKRWITLALSRPCGLLMLVCRNTYSPGSSEQPSPLRHGMGLTIGRAVAAKHGGALELSQGGGVFTAVISCYRPAAEASSAAGHAESG